MVVFVTVPITPHEPRIMAPVIPTFTIAEDAINRKRWESTTFVRSCGMAREPLLVFLDRGPPRTALNGFAFLDRLRFMELYNRRVEYYLTYQAPKAN